MNSDTNNIYRTRNSTIYSQKKNTKYYEMDIYKYSIEGVNKKQMNIINIPIPRKELKKKYLLESETSNS